MSESVNIELLQWNLRGRSARFRFRQQDDILFDLDLQVQLFDERGREVLSQHIGQAGWDIAWLPAGEYEVRVKPDLGGVEAGDYRLKATVSHDTLGPSPQHAIAEHDIRVDTPSEGAEGPPHWVFQARDGVELSNLSWRKGASDWFYLHFDHAARVVVHQFLNDSPKLKGRILDVGCGDGITDLSIFLRCRPELMLGVDPFRGYERLPDIARDNGIPPALLDDTRLRFEPSDANDLPYPDNDFDVVLSWGSLEHIAGGYDQALAEIRRVLKPGGLLFAHPGLFYSSDGNHLAEFFDDPYIHLKLPEDELKYRVLTGQPKRMDRAGHIAKPAEYWQWYQELNRITTQAFEEKVRALGFEPWRVGLRTNRLIEYTPELQAYPMTDLAIKEMYASFVLKK